MGGFARGARSAGAGGRGAPFVHGGGSVYVVMTVR
jgi:hypothetical protein